MAQASVYHQLGLRAYNLPVAEMVGTGKHAWGEILALSGWLNYFDYLAICSLVCYYGNYERAWGNSHGLRSDIRHVDFSGATWDRLGDG